MTLVKIFVISLVAIIMSVGVILIFTTWLDTLVVRLIPRPQHPKERQYIVKEVVFLGGAEEVMLAGEITLPHKGGSFPAIVLIAGSGPHDRDENLAGHKMMLVLSDYLTKRGYAVLRYDKRGIGESTGNYKTATMRDFSLDAAAAMRWLKSQENIDTAHTGYIGHSSGGYIAPLAAQDESAAFLVLLAGSARKVTDEIIYQSTIIPKVMGKDNEWITLNNQVTHEMMTLYGTVVSEGELRVQVEAIFAKYKDDLNLPSNQVEMTMNEGLPFTWWQWAVKYDPIPTLKTYQGPVLAILGGKDLQVSANANMPIFEEILSNAKSQVVTFSNLNHQFQPTKTGNPEEATWIHTTFEEQAMKAVADWLDQRLNETKLSN